MKPNGKSSLPFKPPNAGFDRELYRSYLEKIQKYQQQKQQLEKSGKRMKPESSQNLLSNSPETQTSKGIIVPPPRMTRIKRTPVISQTEKRKRESPSSLAMMKKKHSHGQSARNSNTTTRRLTNTPPGVDAVRLLQAKQELQRHKQRMLSQQKERNMRKQNPVTVKPTVTPSPPIPLHLRRKTYQSVSPPTRTTNQPVQSKYQEIMKIPCKCSGAMNNCLLVKCECFGDGRRCDPKRCGCSGNCRNYNGSPELLETFKQQLQVILARNNLLSILQKPNTTSTSTSQQATTILPSQRTLPPPQQNMRVNSQQVRSSPPNNIPLPHTVGRPAGGGYSSSRLVPPPPTHQEIHGSGRKVKRPYTRHHRPTKLETDIAVNRRLLDQFICSHKISEVTRRLLTSLYREENAFSTQWRQNTLTSSLFLRNPHPAPSIPFQLSNNNNSGIPPFPPSSNNSNNNNNNLDYGNDLEKGTIAFSLLCDDEDMSPFGGSSGNSSRRNSIGVGGDQPTLPSSSSSSSSLPNNLKKRTSPYPTPPFIKKKITSAVHISKSGQSSSSQQQQQNNPSFSQTPNGMLLRSRRIMSDIATNNPADPKKNDNAKKRKKGQAKKRKDFMSRFFSKEGYLKYKEELQIAIERRMLIEFKAVLREILEFVENERIKMIQKTADERRRIKNLQLQKRQQKAAQQQQQQQQQKEQQQQEIRKVEVVGTDVSTSSIISPPPPPLPNPQVNQSVSTQSTSTTTNTGTSTSSDTISVGVGGGDGGNKMKRDVGTDMDLGQI